MGQAPGDGDKAPDFELSDADGKPVRLKDFAGRKLVLYFYPKDDTSGCTRQAIDFNALRAEFARVGTDLLGVSPDSVASHGKFRKKHGLALPLASDEAKDTLNAYGVWTQKSMYGRKYMGVERTTFLIRDGKIARTWRKVSVPGHAEEVLEAAKSF
ncbi:MAG: thioredoxin-dependent peroxiredoxin [Methylobacteriaceae bacterium]|jgi:peroxiredoxin Q/BCP|nr:thioredoxin-dependent peroxiredoxin [Methylobacteriaceae bacterium]